MFRERLFFQSFVWAKYSLVTAFVFFTYSISGQTYKVKGFIHDIENNNWVENAIISVNEQKIYTYTDSMGQFTINTKENEFILRIHHLNYVQKKIRLHFLNDTTIYIPVNPIPKNLNEVIVKQNASIKGFEINRSRESIQKNAMIVGEANIYELLQKTPGVVHSSEVTPGLFVRGLADGNTGTYYNNVNLLGLYHILSIFPTFNSNTIKEFTFYKNNAGLEWHGNLSSYLVVSSENEVQNHNSGEVEVGLLTSKASLTLPLVKKKLSLTANIRRTYFDLIVDFYNQKSTEELSNSGLPDYGFWDGDITLQADMGKSGKFLLSVFSANDKFLMETDQFSLKSKLDNQLGSVTWKKTLSENLSVESNIGFSKYSTQVFFENINSRFLQNNNSIIQSKIKAVFKYSNIKLEFGISQDQLSMNFSTQDEDAVLDNRLETSILYTEYLDMKYIILKNLEFRGGVRLEQYRSGYNVNNIVPLFSINYKLKKNAFELSWTKNNQYQHVYTPLGINLPMKIWYPSDGRYPPEQASQVAFDYSRKITGNLNMTLGAYYIFLLNQVEFLEGNSITSKEYQVDVGRGYSKGIELSIKYSSKQIQAEAGYTFSESRRKFPQINNREWFSPPYDVPHKFDFLFNWNLGRSWNVNLSQFFQSGMMITLPTGIFFHQDADNLKYDETNIIPIYDRRYNFRLQPNHRMDIAFQKTLRKKRLTTVYSFGIYNVYNYQNPYFIYFRPKFDTDTKKFFLDPQKKSLLPMVPFFNIKVVWK